MRTPWDFSTFMRILPGIQPSGVLHIGNYFGMMKRAVSLLPAAKDPVFGPGMKENLAAAEAAVGESERAMTRIERLLVTPYGAFPLTQATLRLDPVWDPLRPHPRFKALLDGPEPKTAYH